MNTPESIMARVVKGDGCWSWTGAHGGKDNRPSVGFNKRQHYVYRLMWEWANGLPFPADLEARHTCDNSSCVNPSHIIPGTHAQNMGDMSDRGRYRLPDNRGEAQAHAHPQSVVDAVLATYKSGDYTIAQVAAMYDLSFHTVSKWMKGEARDVEPPRVRDGRFVATAKCGERAGAAAHRRRGEPVCDDCKRADREYMSAWKTNRRLKAAA